jgi:DNA-binding CsgD family transcriptional regulator
MKQRPRIYYSASQRAVIWDRWRKGDTIHQIAGLFDRFHSSIHRILAETGGIRPAERQRSKSALTLAEREEISRGVVAGSSIRSIAASLGRAPSTIRSFRTRDFIPRTDIRTAALDPEPPFDLFDYSATSPIERLEQLRAIAIDLRSACKSSRQTLSASIRQPLWSRQERSSASLGNEAAIRPSSPVRERLERGSSEPDGLGAVQESWHRELMYRWRNARVGRIYQICHAGIEVSKRIGKPLRMTDWRTQRTVNVSTSSSKHR